MSDPVGKRLWDAVVSHGYELASAAIWTGALAVLALIWALVSRSETLLHRAQGALVLVLAAVALVGIKAGAKRVRAYRTRRQMEDDAPMGLFDHRIARDAALQRVSRFMSRMTRILVSGTKKMNRNSAELNSMGATASPKRQLEFSKSTAAILDRRRETLAALLPDFERALEEFGAAQEYDVNWGVSRGAYSAEQRLHLTNTTRSTLAAFREFVATQHSSNKSLEPLRGFSKALDLAVTRLQAATARLCEVVEKWNATSEAIIRRLEGES